MKKITLHIIFLFILFSASSQSLLKIDDAVNLALKNSLDIELRKNDVEANTILNNYGVAGGLPLVTASASDNEQVSNINQKLNTGTVIERNGATTNTLNANVSSSILLYNGSRVVATKGRLNQLQQQSQKFLNSEIQNIMASVMVAYYDIVRQQSYIITIERSIDAAKQRLEIVQTSQKVGLANNADLFQSQIDLNALLQAKESQQLVIDQSKAELLRLLTLRTDSAVNINDTIIVDRNMTLQATLDGINKNADIQAAEDQIRINSLIVKETAALRYPSVRATAGYNYTRNDASAGQLLLNQNSGFTGGVTIGIPIYNGSAYRRQQKVAEIDVRNAEIQKDVLLRDYNAQVVKTYQSYASFLRQLETEQQTYKLSSQLLELVLQRFQLRQATIVEVKNAQQSFEESGYRLVNITYAAKAAEIELKRLTNLLSL